MVHLGGDKRKMSLLKLVEITQKTLKYKSHGFF
jgi:hypothetical protein